MMVFTVYHHSMYHRSDPQPPNLGGSSTRTRGCINRRSDPQPPNLGGLCTRIRGLVHDENNRNPRASTLHNAPVNPVNLAVRRPPAALLTTVEQRG